MKRQGVGERLRGLREHRKWSLSDVGRMLGKGPTSSHYGKVEREEIGLSPEMAVQLADIYEVREEWIWTGEGDPVKDGPRGLAPWQAKMLDNLRHLPERVVQGLVDLITLMVEHERTRPKT